MTIYSSLGHVSKSGLYSVSMPNHLNFSFDYHLFLIVVMFSYIPSKCLSVHTLKFLEGFPILDKLIPISRSSS